MSNTRPIPFVDFPTKKFVLLNRNALASAALALLLFQHASRPKRHGTRCASYWYFISSVGFCDPWFPASVPQPPEHHAETRPPPKVAALALSPAYDAVTAPAQLSPASMPANTR